jgi:arylformamidase
MKRYIDLSHAIHEGMSTPPAPWHSIVEITQLGRHSIEGRESLKITLGNHTGTHIDTPAHMVENGAPRIDKLPLDVTIGKAKLLNIPKGPYSKITVEDIKSCGIAVQKGDRIVINTGWYKKWDTQQFYREHPSMMLEAANWLVDQGVIYVLFDIPSPDEPLEKLVAGQPNPIHLAFLGKGVFISECMTNLDEIPSTEFELIVLPLLIRDSDGAPVRAVAVVED